MFVIERLPDSYRVSHYAACAVADGPTSTQRYHSSESAAIDSAFGRAAKLALLQNHPTVVVALDGCLFWFDSALLYSPAR